MSDFLLKEDGEAILLETGDNLLIVPEVVTDVFFENLLNQIEQGMKPNTAAGMGGVLIS